MDFNVNVNVKVDKATRLLLQSAILTWMKSMNVDVAEHEHTSQVLTDLADSASKTEEKAESVKASEKEEVKVNEAKEEIPAGKENVFTETMARAARLEAINRVKEDAPEEDKEIAEKLAKKIIKNGFLQSAAFEHERNEEGWAVNKDGERVKTLAELSSIELERFCDLCKALQWDPAEKTVNPSNAA